MSLDPVFWAPQGGSDADATESRALVSHDPESYASSLGIHMLMEGTHDFRLKSGASFRVYASPWTPIHGVSAFQYPTREDRFNTKDAGDAPEWSVNVANDASVIPGYEDERVDIVMVHGPMKSVLDDTPDGRSAGCEHLRRAIARAKPKLLCHGHIHCAYGAQRVRYKSDQADPIVPIAKEWVGKNQAKRKGYAAIPPGSTEEWNNSWKDGKIGQTLCLNAAISDDEGRVGNWPWVVCMDL